MADKKQVFCNSCEANGVKTEIKFDKNVKSDSGKFIPVEVASGNKHSCPFRQKGGNTGSSVPAGQKTIDNSPEAVGARTSELQATVNRIERDVSKLTSIQDTVRRIEQTLAGLVMNAAPTKAAEPEAAQA